jgi:hypothetical protein
MGSEWLSVPFDKVSKHKLHSSCTARSYVTGNIKPSLASAHSSNATTAACQACSILICLYYAGLLGCHMHQGFTAVHKNMSTQQYCNRLCHSKWQRRQVQGEWHILVVHAAYISMHDICCMVCRLLPYNKVAAAPAALARRTCSNAYRWPNTMLIFASLPLCW